ncbi:MAG: ribosome recycling factor [Hyphomicrobiales bacterium]
MTEEALMCLEEAKESMENALYHLEREFQKIRAGKASPSMLEGVMVEFYGAATPLEQTSTINSPDARQLIVQPFDKSTIYDIEKGILQANLGFNPQNEGDILRILVPPLTEERRLNLVKQAKSEAENAKISMRNARRHANDTAKKLEKDGLAEDESKRLQDEIQKATDDFIKQIENILEKKETDIMTV